MERIERPNLEGKFGKDDVRGVSNTKLIQRTKASMDGRDFTPFTILNPQEFVFNRRTTRNGERLGLGFNQDERPYIFTEDYVAFRVKDDRQFLPTFLYMFFLRNEFDRYARWDSWGSATEFFNWENMCEVKIPVPPIDEQRKVVEAWQGLRTLKVQNEQLAAPLLALCRSYLQELKKTWPMVEIGPMMKIVEERNSSGEILPVVGVNFLKEFMPTAANMEGVDTSKYKVMRRGRFVFSGMQTGRDVCIRIALWDFEEKALMSPAYTTFELKQESGVLPEYFFLLFKRGEMDRLGWFYSDSSVRSNLDWSRFEQIKIPLPPLGIQQAVVDLYRCANEAKKIAAEADAKSREICPALMQWVVKEGA